MAHSLKGSAANIGATELSQHAFALEDACREENDAQHSPAMLDGLVASVVAALSRVLASIESLDAPDARPVPQPSDAACSDPSLKTLLTQLAEGIDRADPEAIMKVMPAVKRQAARYNAIDPSILKTLEAQVDRYDYDQALETVRKLNCDKGIP